MQVSAIPAPAPANAGQAGSAQRARNAASDFEGLLIAQMLKSAREESNGGWLGSGSETDSAMAIAEEHLAKLLADAGGLGLARMVESGLQYPERRQSPDRITSAEPGSDGTTTSDTNWKHAGLTESNDYQAK
jgi:Rod binding domain-containing protein